MKVKSTKVIEYAASPELATAISEIRDLTAAKAKVETQIADCLRNLASEKAMLDSLLSQPVTLENRQYLKAAKSACRMGIKAWKLSIKAYQGDIDSYNSEVDDILKRTPEARRDH